MNTTVNAVLYKSKTLKNGEHPLMIRICKDNKKKYKALGISLHAQYWDFSKNQPRRNCPNRDEIERIILEKTKEYKEHIIEYKTTQKIFTAKILIEKVEKPVKAQTVHELLNLHIKRLEASKRLNYSLTFRDLRNSMIKYNKHLDMYFSDIDITWLKNYESWLRGCNLKENTIGIRFRTLRALYNLAIEENIVKADYYPFDTYKVSKLRQQTVKRAIHREDIVAMINHKSEVGRDGCFAIDLFVFSYLMGGINFVDIANLTMDNIHNNQLHYIRKKTKKLIHLPMQPQAMELINKYSTPKKTYIFPILDRIHNTEQQKANRIHKVITKVNKHLKVVGKDLNLPIDITTYVARH
jgi:hypothetical protein